VTLTRNHVHNSRTHIAVFRAEAAGLYLNGFYGGIADACIRVVLAARAHVHAVDEHLGEVGAVTTDIHALHTGLRTDYLRDVRHGQVLHLLRRHVHTAGREVLLDYRTLRFDDDLIETYRLFGELEVERRRQ